MKKCIICRKEKEQKEFSDEHVIPDSIGGYYHIYTVCKTCNSEMGNKVDSKLVNHYFTSFFRYELNIKGKTGDIPNPFNGTHILENDKETKIKLLLDENDIPKPYLLPKIKTTTKGNIKRIDISVDKNDKNKIPDIIKKIQKREKINQDTQINTEEEPTFIEFIPNIKMQKQLDIREFKIALLKIAYEYAVDSIDGYFEDAQAKIISKFLLETDFNKIDNFFIGSGFEKEIIKPLENLFDFEKKRHLLILMNYESLGLICFISLHKLFSIVVKLSENIFFKDNMFIGINDLDKKTFKKTNIFELSNEKYSPEMRTFQYFFDNQQDYSFFLELQSSKEFEYYTGDSNFPLYNEFFKIKYKNIDCLIEEYMTKGNLKYFVDGINPKILIELKEKLYRKFIDTDKFFQVVAIKIEKNLLEKF